MLSVEEIDRTILELENKDTTFANCEKLAWLYTVRDHISGQAAKQPVPIATNGDSDFIRAIDGMDSVCAWNIMDELMQTIRIIQPRMYETVMEKIKSARE
jgi:acyl carrier protein